MKMLFFPSLKWLYAITLTTSLGTLHACESLPHFDRTSWVDFVLLRKWHLCTSEAYSSFVPIRLFMGVHKNIFLDLLALPVLLQQCTCAAIWLLPCCRAAHIAMHSAVTLTQTAHLGVMGSKTITQRINNENQSDNLVCFGNIRCFHVSELLLVGPIFTQPVPQASHS